MTGVQAVEVEWFSLKQDSNIQYLVGRRVNTAGEFGQDITKFLLKYLILHIWDSCLHASKSGSEMLNTFLVVIKGKIISLLK